MEPVLAARGGAVGYETARRSVAERGAVYRAERPRGQARLGRTWHRAETATRVGGRVYWPRRAIDEPGPTVGFLPQAQRDTVAAERSFRRLLTAANPTTREPITADEPGSGAGASF